MEQPFDKSALGAMDISLTMMVNRNYDLCLHICMEDKD